MQLICFEYFQAETSAAVATKAARDIALANVERDIGKEKYSSQCDTITISALRHLVNLTIIMLKCNMNV